MTTDPSKIEAQLEGVQSEGKGLPPLDKWHPELSGNIAIRIQRDGRWLYKGEPLKRESIARLFSTILRRENDGEYYLVTPGEKWRIEVDDAPLLAHSLEVEQGEGDQLLHVTTNMGERLTINADHPLSVGVYEGSEEPRPVITVRHGLEARLVTSAFYDLANYVEERQEHGRVVLGVSSAGCYFPLG